MLFLFAIQQPEQLSKKVRKLLEDPDVPRLISVVSLWEIAVKVQIGKLEAPDDAAFYQEHIRALNAETLAMGVRHSAGLFKLPMLHTDPFDRLLIAQAREEDLTLVTRDKDIKRYEVKTIW